MVVRVHFWLYHTFTERYHLLLFFSPYLNLQRGKSAASDELRSRIKESVLRSSEALSPSNRSRLNRRQAYAKTLGSREPEKLTTGIRPQPDDDEKGGHPDSCSDDVRGKSESDEQEFSEDEDGGDDTDR